MSKFKTITPTSLAYDVSLALALKKAGFKNFERVATFIHQLQFYLSLKSKADIFKMINGQKYTYMNYSEWALVFPHWAPVTIQRIVTEAQETGIVISVLKGRGQQSRSKWYSIDQNILNKYLDDVAEVETYQVDRSKNTVETYQVDKFKNARIYQLDKFTPDYTVVTNTEVLEEEEDRDNFSHSKVTPPTDAPHVDVPNETSPVIATVTDKGNSVKDTINKIYQLSVEAFKNPETERLTTTTITRTEEILSLGYGLSDFVTLFSKSHAWHKKTPRLLSVVVKNPQTFEALLTFQVREEANKVTEVRSKNYVPDTEYVNKWDKYLN